MGSIGRLTSQKTNKNPQKKKTYFLKKICLPRLKSPTSPSLQISGLAPPEKSFSFLLKLILGWAFYMCGRGKIHRRDQNQLRQLTLLPDQSCSGTLCAITKGRLSRICVNLLMQIWDNKVTHSDLQKQQSASHHCFPICDPTHPPPY